MVSICFILKRCANDLAPSHVITGLMSFNDTEREGRAYEFYREKAKLLLEDASTRRMNELIDEVYKERELPFIFVEGSSGTGKTQMGMTLLQQSLAGKSRRKVYYLLSYKLSDQSQSIYLFFSRPSSLFYRCYEEDFRGGVPELTSDLLKRNLFVFGFIDKLLFGNLYGSEENVKLQQMNGNHLKEKIQRTWKVDERPVVILDECFLNDESNGNLSLAKKN